MKTTQEIYLMNPEAFKRFSQKESKSNDIKAWHWSDIREDGSLLRVVIERKART